MIVPRRPPWWQHPELVSPWESSDLFVLVDYSYCLIASRHVEFTLTDWQDGVLMSTWVEVVLLDEMLALRQTTSVLTREQARVRRSGEELVQVYLPVWRADRLERV